MAGLDSLNSFVALYIFMLAVVTGYELISKAPLILQMPLLSATTFINGIVLIGAMIVMGNAETTMQMVIGFIAVTLAAANAVGGYVISSRLLDLFKQNAPNNSNKTGDN